MSIFGNLIERIPEPSNPHDIEIRTKEIRDKVNECIDLLNAATDAMEADGAEGLVKTLSGSEVLSPAEEMDEDMKDL